MAVFMLMCFLLGWAVGVNCTHWCTDMFGGSASLPVFSNKAARDGPAEGEGWSGQRGGGERGGSGGGHGYQAARQDTSDARSRQTLRPTPYTPRPTPHIIVRPRSCRKRQRAAALSLFLLLVLLLSSSTSYHLSSSSSGQLHPDW